MPILFITNPGEQISGMQEIPGWCVKLHGGDRIAAFITPDHSEPAYRDNIPRRGAAAGNGRFHEYTCWDFNPAWLREQRRFAHLDEAIAKVTDECNADRELLDEALAEVKRLADRVSALEGGVVSVPVGSVAAAKPDLLTLPKKKP